MQWKSIKDYEGYYEVSDSGIVRSLDRDVHDRMLGNKHRGVRVAQIDTTGNTVGEFPSISQASRITGVSRGMISHCIHNRATFAGGYKWKLIEKCNDYLFTESTAEDELLLEAQGLA